MMKAEQLEQAAGIAANVAYVLVVCSLLIIMFPALRRPLQRTASRLLYDYRHGLWLAKQPRKAPVPAWVPRAFQGERVLPPE
jgi:hypothetical protein